MSVLVRDASPHLLGALHSSSGRLPGYLFPASISSSTSYPRSMGADRSCQNPMKGRIRQRSPAVGGPVTTSNNEAVAVHVNQARDFLAKSREYLSQGDLHQASEKGWGATAHMVKAMAIAQGWEYERQSDFSQVLNSAYLATGGDQIRLLRGRGTPRAPHRRGHRRWQPRVGGRSARPHPTSREPQIPIPPPKTLPPPQSSQICTTRAGSAQHDTEQVESDIGRRRRPDF